MSERLSWPPARKGRFAASRHEVVLFERDRANVETLARSLFPGCECKPELWNLSHIVRTALEHAACVVTERKATG